MNHGTGPHMRARRRRRTGGRLRLLQVALVTSGIAFLLGASILLLTGDGGGPLRSAADRAVASGELTPPDDAEPISETLARSRAPSAEISESLSGIDPASMYAGLIRLALAIEVSTKQKAKPAPEPTAEPAARPPATPTATAAASTTACTAVATEGFALSLFGAINNERTSRGLAPLVLDGCVAYVAQLHSSDMAARGYFSHLTPEGGTVFALLTQHGVAYNWAGENLARNDYPANQTVAVAIRDLMASPTHRQNILSGSFSRLGVSMAIDGAGFRYFAMVFTG